MDILDRAEGEETKAKILMGEFTYKGGRVTVEIRGMKKSNL